MAGKRISMLSHRVNDRITATMVRLVLDDGEHVGVVPREEALEKATERDLDLVEIVPTADPPVCKVLDYGKFKYREKKRGQRQKHHRTDLKEIRIGLETAEHDLKFKADQGREFLQRHDKVLISMHLRGRAKAHGDQAVQNMRDFASRFENVAKVERPATRESAGRVTMLLSPK